MSITTSKDVFCDVCSAWIHGGIECDAKHARGTARLSGWKRKKLNGKLKDICPRCLEVMSEKY